MMYDAIDSLVMPVQGTNAQEAWARLGLPLSPPVRPVGWGIEALMLPVGGAGNRFVVEFVRQTDAAAVTRHPQLGQFAAGLAQPGGPLFLGLRVPDMTAALAALTVRGIAAEAMTVTREDGSIGGMVAFLPAAKEAVMRLALVQRITPLGDGPATGALQPKRLDHLAAVAPDLEDATRYWTETLGVPVFGEVRTPMMIIRQFKIGDAILELLGPATPDSPVAARSPGLAGMIAVEVPDLAAAVAAARAAGFSPPDPATGVLPGTRTATVPAAELGGLGLQLLEYV